MDGTFASNSLVKQLAGPEGESGSMTPFSKTEDGVASLAATLLGAEEGVELEASNRTGAKPEGKE